MPASWGRAVAWYAEQGIAVERVLTDNAKAYHARAWIEATQGLGIRRRYTRIYRPRTNGKAERFIQTLLAEWAYARMTNGEGRLSDRSTPLAGAMVERVPADGRWYLSAVCYSAGQATSLASHISRGGYGRNVNVAHGLIPNANKRGMKREHAVLLRKTRGR